ncbi:MAG: hypothetical protein QOH31_2466 [Verrucomicrobiota bacterium]|jgi:hypothetical protein
MSRIVVFFSVFACLTSFQACSSSSSQLSPQQVAAYSVATGFLTLCDDGNYKNALYFYTEPIRSYPEGATWITQTRGKRAPFGIPIWRDWVNRQQVNESPKMAFQFRTSFTSEPLVDELVSVERICGQWQVYDYKFHALGKHPSPTPASKHAPPVPTHLLPPGASRSPSPMPSPSQPPLPATSP